MDQRCLSELGANVVREQTSAIRVEPLDRTATLESPLNRRFYAWWLTQSEDRRPPHHRRFDIADHLALAPNLIKLRIGAGLVECRVVGERVKALTGLRRMPRRLKPNGDLAIDPVLDGLCRLIAKDQRCGLLTGELSVPDSGRCRVEAVGCPLTDDDGSVSTIIMVLDEVGGGAPLP